LKRLGWPLLQLGHRAVEIHLLGSLAQIRAPVGSAAARPRHLLNAGRLGQDLSLFTFLVLVMGFQMLFHVVRSGELLRTAGMRARNAFQRVVDLGVTRGMAGRGEGLVTVVLDAVFAFVLFLGVYPGLRGRVGGRAAGRRHGERTGACLEARRRIGSGGVERAERILGVGRLGGQRRVGEEGRRAVSLCVGRTGIVARGRDGMVLSRVVGGFPHERRRTARGFAVAGMRSRHVLRVGFVIGFRGSRTRAVAVEQRNALPRGVAS